MAVVEYVNDDGSIFLSNSGYPDNYFWTCTVTQSSGYRENWMISRGYQLQGFIYAYDMPPTIGGTPEDYYIMWLQGEGLNNGY